MVVKRRLLPMRTNVLDMKETTLAGHLSKRQFTQISTDRIDTLLLIKLIETKLGERMDKYFDYNIYLGWGITKPHK